MPLYHQLHLQAADKEVAMPVGAEDLEDEEEDEEEDKEEEEEMQEEEEEAEEGAVKETIIHPELPNTKVKLQN